MKRSLWLSVILILAGVVVFSLACRAVNREKESIKVTETTLFGDVQATEGIQLEIDTHWDSRLLWTTKYEPGRTEEAESSFRFSGEEVQWKGENTAYVEINVYSGYGTAMGYDGSTGKELETEVDITTEPIALVLQAVADKTAPGEKHTEIVALRDYYEYYPALFESVNVDKKIHGYGFWSDELSEYFGLSVPEDDLYQVTIEKNTAGAVVGFQYNGYGGGYYLTNCSTFGSSGCYYAFYRENEGKHTAEYGEQRCYIYYLPYQTKEQPYSAGLSLNMEGIEKACMLPEGVIPVELALDGEESRLYVAAKDETQFYLFVYETEEGRLSECQQLPVLEGEKSQEGETVFPYYRKMTVQEDGILMTWEENCFAFLTEEDGSYRVWCIDSFPAAEEGGEDSYVSASFLENESPFPNENTFAFDGERLAIAAFAKWEDLSTRLLVYREGELAYSGFFEYSGEIDKAFGLSGRNSIQAQGASYGSSRAFGMTLNPLKVTIR